MVRRIAYLSLAVAFVVLGVVADEKKKPAKTAAKTSTATSTALNTDTSTISAAEGTTMMAIRGVMAAGDGAAVIGFANGVVTARDRVSGRTFKFNVPPTSNIHIGDNVVVNSGFAQIAGLAGRFKVYGAEGCCSVAAVNASDHTVTVREGAVGRTFVMKFASGPPVEFRVGAPVAADFKSGKAWLPSNVVLQTQITNLTPPSGLHP